MGLIMHCGQCTRGNINVAVMYYMYNILYVPKFDSTLAAPLMIFVLLKVSQEVDLLSLVVNPALIPVQKYSISGESGIKLERILSLETWTR